MNKEIYVKKQNFFLVRERTSTKGVAGLCIIRSSGYTSTIDGIMQPWVLTQFKTVPCSNRVEAGLPDPFILPQPMLPVYKDLDCTVFNMYFLPECQGIKEAMIEFADFIEKEFYKMYPEVTFIGHSKGGLFMAGLTKYLSTPTNIIMVTPTFGTITGNESMMIEKLEEYKENQKSKIKKVLITPEIGLYKFVTHVTGSRRPIDYDMSPGSKLLTEELDLSNLDNHRTMLVTAECPKHCNLSEAIFKHYGKFIGLDKWADGMVPLVNQRLPLQFSKEMKVVHIEATHPTVLNKCNSIIKEFLCK